MKPVDLDEIYRRMSQEEIPWNIDEEPPEALVELVETGKVRPCKTLDLGCGTDHYAIDLASKGFDVTGVDICPTAVRIAGENAKKKGAKCRFLVADLLGDWKEVEGRFDFAYDWELLHHIFPPDREKYVGNVARLLRPGGRYLSVCFSEESAQFGGAGKYRRTPLDTVLYFSSEREMISLFETLFVIDELKTIDIEGKVAPHKAVYAFMKKRR